MDGVEVLVLALVNVQEAGQYKICPVSAEMHEHDFHQVFNYMSYYVVINRQ